MVTKVIYIAYQPLTKKVEEDFYINELNKINIKVEYWDLSEIYFPNLYSDTLKLPYIVKIADLKCVNKKLQDQDNTSTVYIVIITYTARVLNLFRLLTKNKCYLAFFARGASPANNVSISANTLLLKLNKIFTPSLLYRFSLNKIAALYKRAGLVKPYNLIFTAGKYGIEIVGFGAEIDKLRSTIINVNSFDYDRVYHIQNEPKLVVGRYAIFLDEYLPYHPDFALSKLNTIPPENYYHILNRFFIQIELQFNLRVIVASHPKADKYKGEDLFSGREVFFNKTAELTKDCVFAIAHNSTSVNFAVLFQKPILFTYSDDIKTIMPYYYRIIANLSNKLGGNFVNINKYEPNESFDMAIDHLKYIDYKYKYLTSKDSENKMSSEIFCNALINL